MPMMRGDAAPPSHAAAKLRSALHQSRSQSAMAEAHAHNVRPRLIISMYRAQSQPTITAPSHFFAKQPRPAEARTESIARKTGFQELSLLPPPTEEPEEEDADPAENYGGTPVDATQLSALVGAPRLGM